MQYIVDFFKSLGEIISTIVDLIIDLVEGIIKFFTDLPTYIDLLESYLELIPTPFIVMFTMVLACTLLFVVIGRRGT